MAQGQHGRWLPLDPQHPITNRHGRPGIDPQPFGGISRGRFSADGGLPLGSEALAGQGVVPAQAGGDVGRQSAGHSLLTDERPGPLTGDYQALGPQLVEGAPDGGGTDPEPFP